MIQVALIINISTDDPEEAYMQADGIASWINGAEVASHELDNDGQRVVYLDPIGTES